MSDQTIEKIKQTIEGYKDDPQWEEIGTVTEVGDGILKISGLKNVQSQEVLSIESASAKGSGVTKAVVLNLEENYKKQQQQAQDLVFKNAVDLVKKTIIKTVQLKPTDVDDALIQKAVDSIKNEK